MDFDDIKDLKELPEEGSFENVPFGAVLSLVFRQKLSGCLLVDSEHGENRLYFKNGVPVHAYLAEGIHFLGRVLLEMNLIDDEQYNRSLEIMMKTGSLQGQLLVEEDLIDAESLEMGLLYQLRRKVNHFFKFKTHPFRFVRGSGQPDRIPMDVPLAMIHPLWAVHNGVFNMMQEKDADRFLAPIMNANVKTSADIEDLIDAFGFSKEKMEVVERLSISRPVADFVSNSGLSRAEAKFLLCVLAMCGMIEVAASSDVEMEVDVSFEKPGEEAAVGEPEISFEYIIKPQHQKVDTQQAEPAPQPQAPEQAPPPAGPPSMKSPPEQIALLRETITEKHVLIEKASYFDILEVREDATPEEVKKAYLHVAKIFHPDSLAGTGIELELSSKIKDILAVARTAYETLCDDKKKSEYIEKQTAAKEKQEAPKAKLDPKEAEINFHRGKLYMSKGDFAWAERFFKKAVDLSGGNAKFLSHYGWSVYRNPQREKPDAKELAVKLIKDALAKEANDGMSHHFLAQIFKAEGDYKMAAHHERLSKRITPGTDFAEAPDETAPAKHAPKGKGIFDKFITGLKKKK